MINLKIAVVGLGLIGGSLAKTIKKNSDDICYGLDIDRSVVVSALSQEAIDGEITPDRLNICDIVIVSLYPQETIDFILQNKNNFKKGSIVIDTCGIKASVVSAVEEPLKECGVTFLGCHPMAGREFSGFAYSVDNLFDKASFIMTPTDNTPVSAIQKISAFAYKIGFAKCVVSDPQEHDKIIAFTSQLAHVVSNAYIKSPSLLKQAGFSAGSFKDLTRVAKLNEDMWTTLFMMNKQPLLEEINHIINSLEQYRDAIENDDNKKLHDLLKEGRELKEMSNNQTKN